MSVAIESDNKRRKYTPPPLAMPKIGIGTYKMDATEDSVLKALQLGHRLIDAVQVTTTKKRSVVPSRSLEYQGERFP